MPFTGSWFAQGSFPWTADFARRRQAGFREALFLGEVVVFDERLFAVGVKFGEEVLVDEADVRFDVVDCYGGKEGWCGEGGGEGGR